jgi:hypothetical protein
MKRSHSSATRTGKEPRSGVRSALLSIATTLASGTLLSCGPPRIVEPEAVPPPVPMQSVPQDVMPKEEPRLVPAEAYMRTYLELFSTLVPIDAQKRAKGSDGAQLFDTWDDYFASLGFPDYRLDLPRGQVTNALMVATFERVGVALCDRAVEHDIKANTPLASRQIFAFDPADPADVNAFAPKFDVLHRTFLGYPAALAPTDRTARFFALYKDVQQQHAAKKTRFTPPQAAWAAVCYGLVRHPEFHLY